MNKLGIIIITILSLVILHREYTREIPYISDEDIFEHIYNGRSEINGIFYFKNKLIATGMYVRAKSGYGLYLDSEIDYATIADNQIRGGGGE